jgi:uncharacterized membrane protein YtjA (UPF0391 family)
LISRQRDEVMIYQRRLLCLECHFFLIVALIAAVFGFGGIASTSAGIAKILFGIFLVLFLISALVGAIRGRAPL